MPVTATSGRRMEFYGESRSPEHVLRHGWATAVLAWDAGIGGEL
jgi:hypothetical protein